MNSKLTLVMPSFNEKDNIKRAILNLTEFLKKNNLDYELIIVDDNSDDGTIDIIEKLRIKNKKIKLVIRTTEFGFGSALVNGTKRASNEFICWVMGDSSDDLRTILKMKEKLDLGYDMVIGSRNVKGGSRGDQNPSKAIGSRIYSLTAKFLFDLPVYDITNACRMCRKEVFKNVKLERYDFAISPECAIKTYGRGFKLGEVPTTYQERKIGEAKTKLMSMGLTYFRLLFRYRFVRL